MRRFVVILFLSLLSLVGLSQAQPDEQHGGFCSLNGQFFSVEKGMSVTIGGTCGFVVKDFRIGAYFDGMSKTARVTGTDSNPYSLKQSHGGVYLAYPFFYEHAFHLVTDIKLGYGSSMIINATTRKGEDKAGFVAIVPSAAVEYSITDILMISLGINYQFHIKVKTPEFYKQSKLNTPGVYLSLTLGLF